MVGYGRESSRTIRHASAELPSPPPLPHGILSEEEVPSPPSDLPSQPQTPGAEIALDDALRAVLGASAGAISEGALEELKKLQAGNAANTASSAEAPQTKSQPQISPATAFTKASRDYDQAKRKADAAIDRLVAAENALNEAKQVAGKKVFELHEAEKAKEEARLRVANPASVADPLFEELTFDDLAEKENIASEAEDIAKICAELAAKLSKFKATVSEERLKVAKENREKEAADKAATAMEEDHDGHVALAVALGVVGGSTAVGSKGGSNATLATAPLADGSGDMDLDPQRKEQRRKAAEIAENLAKDMANKKPKGSTTVG